MPALLVTGGCGFIGSHFIKGFLKSHKDWNVVNLDKLTYCGNRANTRSLEEDPRYRFVQGDISDPGAVNATMEGVSGVVHFAAETHVDRSIDNTEDFLVTNVLGTRQLLEAARRYEVERFIHVSTDEVYGSVDRGAADEEAPLLPNSPYSASKAASDLLARSYWKTYRYPVIITRSTNNFGPFQYPEKVIPLFITNLIEGKKVPLYGTGENRRDWIYVEDHCRGIELVLAKGVPGEIYNIAGGNEKSNLELTRSVLKLMNENESKIERVKDRPGHDFRYSVNAGKIKALGFQPRASFEDALKITIEWYRNQEKWWKPLKKDKYTIK